MVAVILALVMQDTENILQVLLWELIGEIDHFHLDVEFAIGDLEWHYHCLSVRTGHQYTDIGTYLVEARVQ